MMHTHTHIITKTIFAQARLIHGEGTVGDLDTPITVNSVSTNGQK